MGELFTGWRLVPSRIRAGWRLLVVTAAGVLVAAALLAAGPLYATALSNLGLQFRLDLAVQETRLSTVTVNGLVLGAADDVARRAAIDTAFDARVGWLGPERLVEARSPWLDLDFVPPVHAEEPGEAEAEEAAEEAGDGAEPATAAATASTAEPAGESSQRQPWNAFLYWLSGFEQHVTVVEGRLPGPAENGTEVVLLAGFEPHASVGDVVYLTLRTGFDDCDRLAGSDDPSVARQEVRCRPTTGVSRSLSATVVGFVAPNDPDDPRWEIFSGNLEAPSEPLFAHIQRAAGGMGGEEVDLDFVRASSGEGSMPLLTSEEQLFGPFAAAMPRVPVRHRVGLIGDPRAVSLGDVERGIEGVGELRRDLEERLGLTPLFQFPFQQALSGFRNTQTFEQVPLMIILLQVVGIVIYYVGLVSSMFVERQAEELGVLRSRGASTAQLMGLYVVEGALIAAAAAVAGAWVAARAVGALGYTPAFSAMTGGGALPVSVTPTVYLLAAGGALLALIALLLPAFALARRGIVDVKAEQARPPGRSFFQRYYLDMVVVVVAGVMLWQLSQRGTVFNPSSVTAGSSAWSADPVLLAAPFVFTLAVAALVLRFYPLVLRWTVGALLAGGGTAVALGLRRAARSPAAYARIMLLLLMAISVGTFAASYGPTVDRSQSDRISYQVGADLRGSLSDPEDPSAAEKVAEVRDLPGVDDAGVAYRTNLISATGTSLALLALDPERAASVLWFREDFADETLAAMMRRLQSTVPSGGGVELTEGAQAIRFWMYLSSPRERSILRLRFRDGQGSYVNTRVGPMETAGWQEVTVPVPGLRSTPVSFVGFYISEPPGTNVPERGAMYVDDIREVLGSGDEVLIEDFEGRFGWAMFSSRSSNERFGLSDERARSGRFAARWGWSVGRTPEQRYLVVQKDLNLPLAAIANPAGAARVRAGAGGIGTLTLGEASIPVQIREIVEMFPTLDPDAPFLILNFEHLNEMARMLDAPFGRWPSELWAALDGSLEEQEALRALLQSSEAPLRMGPGALLREERLENVRSDPTLRASGSGILTAAFAAVLVLAMIGFVVTLVLGARARTVEFAVLRAIGSSASQVLRSMMLEWGVVLAIGTAIGVLLGRRIAAVMLSFLDVTERGARVVPPFIVETDWRAVGLGVGALAAVAVLGLLVAWGSSVRRPTGVELRLTR